MKYEELANALYTVSSAECFIGAAGYAAYTIGSAAYDAEKTPTNIINALTAVAGAHFLYLYYNSKIFSPVNQREPKEKNQPSETSDNDEGEDRFPGAGTQYVFAKNQCSVASPSDYDFFELLRSNDLKSQLKWIAERSDHDDPEVTNSIDNLSYYILFFFAKANRKRHLGKLKLLNPDKFNKKGPVDLTLGHCFAWSGDLDELKDVLRLGLINTEYLTTNQEPTIWHYLALSGNWKSLKQAIDEKLFDPKALEDNEYGTIWYWLAKSGNLGALKEAIASGLCNQKQLNKSGATIWHGLARSGNFAALQQAIEEGLLKPSELEKTAERYGLGHCLAFSGNLEGLQEAIKRGWCNPKELNVAGETSWDVFAISGNTAAIMKAVDLGLINLEKVTTSEVMVLDLIFLTNERELLPYSINRNFNFSTSTLDIAENLRHRFALLDKELSIPVDLPDPALSFVSIIEKLKREDPTYTPDRGLFTLKLILNYQFKFGKRADQEELIALLKECCLLPASSRTYPIALKIDIFDIILEVPRTSDVTPLLDLPLIKNASSAVIDDFLNKAIELQKFELVNLFLGLPEMRQIAKKNALFIQSMESGLLLDIDNLDSGGDGNVSIAYKSYPDQYHLTDKINSGLIPLFRDRKYAEESLQEIENSEGVCLGLSYLFLYAMEQSKDKVDVDNINYFERMLQLIMDTDFEAIKTKSKLTTEDSELINELDRFLQLLLLYQIPVDLGLVDKDKYTDESGNILHTIRQKASLFSITDDNRGSKVNLGGVDPQELFLSSHKIDVEEPFSSSSLGRLSCGKIAGIDFDKIVGSPFECFLVNFTGHVIAVRRDSENKDLFWVYDPNSVAMASATIKKLGNPAKVGAKYLEAYLREIAYVYSKEYPTDTAVGFNFTKPEPRALSSTKVKIKKSV